MNVYLTFDKPFVPAIAAHLGPRAIARIGGNSRGYRKNTTIRRAGKAQVGDDLVLTIAGTQDVIGVAPCLAVTPLSIILNPTAPYGDGRSVVAAHFFLDGHELPRRAAEVLIDRDTAGQMDVQAFIAYMIERVGADGLMTLALYLW